MRRVLNVLSASACVVLLLLTHGARAAARASCSSAAEDIQAVLMRQAAEWNRGDLDAFADSYKNSPDILFIGGTIQHGYAEMLAGYKKHYPSRASMGTLRFTQLEVQPLDARFATATGHYHLERTKQGGGNADGHFLLVLEKTGAGWKIVRDDTTTETLAK